MTVKKRPSPPITIFATTLKKVQPSPAQWPLASTSEVAGGGPTLISAPVTPATTSLTELPPKPLSKEELLNRAKANIEFGELTYRERHIAAADDIAVVYDDGRGATQREIARSLGKSAAWVNQILRWRREGYVGLPFAVESVQDLNNEADTPISEATIEDDGGTKPEDTSAEDTDPPSALEGKETVLPDDLAETPDILISGTAVAAVGRSEADKVSTSESSPSSQMKGEGAVLRDGMPDTLDDLGHQEKEDSFAVSNVARVISKDEQRRGLIEYLDYLNCQRPRLRAAFALTVEKRRAELGLTWDQLIIPASNMSRMDRGPGS